MTTSLSRFDGCDECKTDTATVTFTFTLRGKTHRMCGPCIHRRGGYDAAKEHAADRIAEGQ